MTDNETETFDLELQQEQQVTVIEDTEQEDSMLVEGILLPTYEDLTEQNVLKNVREVFHGFSFDSTENFGKRFQDINQLAQYVEASSTDIKACRRKAETADLLQRAAAMARFWYLGTVLDRALKQGSYGTSASGKLASLLGKAVSYIYQIRAVAERLTVTDCYLLGMRGCDSTTLRQLAQIRDDATRSAVIKAFIDSFVDTSDKQKMETAKRELKAAIVASRKATAIEATSDPNAGGSDLIVSEEYTRLYRAVEKWRSMLKKPASEEAIEELSNAAADFFIMDSVPSAEDYLTRLKDDAKELETEMTKVIENLQDAIGELQSFAATKVLTAEEAENEASDTEDNG